MRLAWTESAIVDLEHIRRYVTAFRPEAATRLARRIAAAAALLETRAAAGTGHPGIGQIAIVYPFLIRYRVADEMVVLSVRHSTRAMIR